MSGASRDTILDSFTATDAHITDYLSSLVLACGISFGSIALAFCAVKQRIRSGGGGAAALGARMLIQSRRQAAMV